MYIWDACSVHSRQREAAHSVIVYIAICVSISIDDCVVAAQRAQENKNNLMKYDLSKLLFGGTNIPRGW